MTLENIEEIHKRGGDCDKQRDNLWRAIRKVEGDVVNERIEAVKLSTKIAIYTGIICGLPAFVLVLFEIWKASRGG